MLPVWVFAAFASRLTFESLMPVTEELVRVCLVTVFFEDEDFRDAFDVRDAFETLETFID